MQVNAEAEALPAEGDVFYRCSEGREALLKQGLHYSIGDDAFRSGKHGRFSSATGGQAQSSGRP